MFFTLNLEVGDDKRIRVKDKNGRKTVEAAANPGRRSRSTEWARVGKMRWRVRVTEGAGYFQEKKDNENGS